MLVIATGYLAWKYGTHVRKMKLEYSEFYVVFYFSLLEVIRGVGEPGKCYTVR
jgi:hypothetical protein